MTRRSLLVAFSVAHFAHHVTNSLLSALLPFISAAFGLSYTSAGFLVGSYSIASGLTNAPLAVLADRIGARRVIVWGLVLIGLSSIAIGLSTEYWQLIAFLAVMGLASGTYHAPASALISSSKQASSAGGDAWDRQLGRDPGREAYNCVLGVGIHGAVHGCYRDVVHIDRALRSKPRA